jgi:nucleoside-diphosphate-sugar epimerase
MKNVVVTGGSGKAGRAVVRDLMGHGYNVLNVDVAPSRDPVTKFLKADLTDLGQTIEALSKAEAVVHLAAIPAPELLPDELTFRINMSSTYNVFSAAMKLGMKRVVWASSETTLGLPFDKEQPDGAPIDETQTLLPQSSYALSKVLGEEMARQFSRWSGIPFVGLRISNIMEPDDYQKFPTYWDDAKIRKWNLWGYVDARDVAQACRLGLEANVTGADHYIIAAADTCMTRPNKDLLAEVFPNLPQRGDVGEHTTLLNIDKAKKVLGYAPQYSWREYVKAFV